MKAHDARFVRQQRIFSLASNTPVGLGIGKDSVTSKPSHTFPYVPPVAD